MAGADRGARAEEKAGAAIGRLTLVMLAKASIQTWRARRPGLSLGSRLRGNDKVRYASFSQMMQFLPARLAS